jgi:3-phenylpropionate/trans-cinnamate dioxygenase ferredoxin reductase subunit
VPVRKTFMIVGGGLAGAKAAETLRADGFDGRVVLIGAEPHLPYERPPLSKGYLAGASPFAEAYVHDEPFYDANEIELVTGQEAASLDPLERRVVLADGRALGYDRLLLATGAIPRRPPIDGAEHEGVLVLRTVDDADALQARLQPGARLAVIGAGWIGSEIAATARGRGVEVTLLAQAAAPLQHVLGPRIAGFFADLHRGHGVDLRTGVRVVRIVDGRSVILEGGEGIDADVVVVGVGVAPATSLATAAGLHVDDGIVTDATLRASADGIFAAGDVASAFHPRYGRHLRVEHWANAADQGAAAARSMLDSGDPYVTVPYFFSDQYDVGMEYHGLHAPEDRVVLRGDPGDGLFQALWVGADGRVTAAMHVNDWDAGDAIRELVAGSASISPEELAGAVGA